MDSSGSQPAVVEAVVAADVATVAAAAAAAVVAAVVVAAVVLADVVLVAAADDEGQVPRLKLVVVGLLAHRQGLSLFQSSLIELKINFRR